MADSETAASQPNWRISKACQECRHRKIRCNGESPCKTCSLRRTPCVYREVIRQRKKKQKPQQDAKPETSDSANVPTGTRPGVQSHREDPPPSFNNSVSATHMTSPSNTVQLYYGSTSHFALMHEIYRDLTAHPARDPAERHGRVEEVGAGLDMLSFRSIFFGIPADQSGDHTRRSVGADPHIMFLPYELANTFLESFLGSLYYLLPIWPPEVFYRRLEKLYGPSPDPRTDYYQCILLMALALGSLITEHAAWGDVLYERVRASCSSLDDTVNLQAHAHYHNEVGRPNSCFLHIGTAARKAISTGLHKESPNESADTVDSAEERRRTFWYLYIYETWVCFHLGRPSSLSRRDVGIPLPKDAFCHTITSLADAAARSADELYGQHHGSLLQMWRIAKSIWDDLRTFDSKMQAALGFGLDKRPQPGGRGVMQTMCITLYYQIILLTFRPFLIFRGRWNQDSRIGTSTADSEKPSPKREIPPWLNEACGYALSAAIRTIHFLCESYTANDLVRGIRYHAYFLGSSCFALIFDLIHGKDLAATHLPWIHATLQALSSMRPGDPIQASILAIQTILKQIDPAYEWSPVQSQPATAHPLHSYTSSQGTPARTYLAPAPASGPTPGVHTSDPHTASALLDSLPSTFLPGATHDNPFLYDFQGNSLEQGMRVGVGIAGSGPGEELLDFTLSDMGGDFDFSTMDLETFFSITPGFGPGV
ncbi:fungal-specific transcription factor domain-containing protein [Aspergillus karnatakaensis]|uniref:Zn(II)2Cys6 transcription factor n=1 Tax=Aspergillus karnatakaensis TaxID=1810916 RepID=UPI003CCD3D72